MRSSGLLLLAGAGIITGVLYFRSRSEPGSTPAGLESTAGLVGGSPSDSAGITFVEGADTCGLRFTHQAGHTAERYMPEVMGAGLAIADFNRDGAPDIVLVDSGNIQAPGPNNTRLFINDGRGRFTDRTAEWNLSARGYGMGAAVGDYDGDGWVDLFLTGFGRAEALLRNTGSGFVDVTAAAGLCSDDAWSASAGFFDLDLDGDLDLYVTRYVDYTLDKALKCYLKGVHVYCTPIMYEALPDRLWRNNGDGTFTDISREAGLQSDPGKGLAVAIGDIDLDGDDDLYVANDTSRNFLLINDGRGGLTDQAMLSGVAYDEFGKEDAGMGTDISDVNEDGRPDIACTNFQNESTSIYRQDGASLSFYDVSDAMGVSAAARTRLKFGIDFFDADNDGDEDLLVANGHICDNVSTYTAGVTFEQQNTLYENNGAGRLEDISDRAGPALAARAVSRGLATSDLDGDGDLDFVITNNGGAVQVGLNVTPACGNFVGLWLEGRESNRSAIGARVEARIATEGRERHIRRQIMGAGSYLSAGDFRVHLGLGSADHVDELKILWPAGKSQVIENLAAGRHYHVIEGQDPQPFVPGERTIPPR